MTYQNLGDSVLLRKMKYPKRCSIYRKITSLAWLPQPRCLQQLASQNEVCVVSCIELQFYPYKLQLTQMMSKDDHLKRVQYALFLLNRIDILDSIMWTDEAYFSMNGYVHRKNCVIWGYRETQINCSISAPFSTSVCLDWIYRQHHASSFLLHWNSERKQLSRQVGEPRFPELRRRHLINHVIFQQEGAPPHFSKAARELLSSQLPDTRIITQRFPQTGPPCSPDLSPLGYYLWGTMKSRVPQFRPKQLEPIKRKNHRNCRKH